MLSFATEFPINCVDTGTFIEAVRSWVLGSPHTDFTPELLAGAAAVGAWKLETEHERIEGLTALGGEEGAAAVRYHKFEGDLEWLTTIVFSRRDLQAWVGVRTSRESAHPAVELPWAKKPLIVRFLLDRFGGAADGELVVSRTPYFLQEDEIDKAARLILGTAGCHLPIVYVSSGFSGAISVDANALASDLCGMAHVVVEPSRPFSRRLQIEVHSENVYGGAIGLYWPEGAGRRTFFPYRSFERSKDLKRAVNLEMRAALLNRRPMPRCTWGAVQEAVFRQTYETLKASGSSEIQSYVDIFDAEMAAKDERLRDAEQEIARLRGETRRYDTQTAKRAEIKLGMSSEQELYAGEFASIVSDTLAEGITRAMANSRRQHVLQALVDANRPVNAAKNQRDELKEILRHYKSMDRPTRAALEGMGFTITEDGKHYKLIFQDDDRYTFILSKSGSDSRGGLNAASDISKRIF